MKGFHVTTPKKLNKYSITGAILPPVRFWPDITTAIKWAKKTGRTLIVEFNADISYPLPDHKPARWTPELVRNYKLQEVE